MHENILILTNGESHEAWGSLVKLCKAHTDFSYDYLKRLKFPIKYKGYDIVRVPFNGKSSDSDSCPYCGSDLIITDTRDGIKMCIECKFKWGQTINVHPLSGTNTRS